MELDQSQVEVKRNLQLDDELSHLFPQVSLSSLVLVEVLEIALAVLLVHQVALPLGEHGDRAVHMQVEDSFLLVDLVCQNLKLFRDEVHDQVFERVDVHEALPLGVVLAPHSSEGVEALLADPYILLLGGRCEALKNDSYEEIEENEADDEKEGDKVEVGRAATTALDPHFLLGGI